MASKKTSIQTLKKMKDPVSVKEYAEQIKKSVWVVQILCKTGKLDCVKIGKEWFIEAKVLQDIHKNAFNKNG